MPGKFVIKRGTSGQYHFNLVSTNGQVVATSQRYTTKESCKEGIAPVKQLAAKATIDDQS